MKNNSFEKLNNKVWKRITIGGVCAILVLSVAILATSRAKYRVTESIKIGEGVVNYKLPDFKIVEMYISEDGTNYTELNDRMPSSGYEINETKSFCNNVNNELDPSAKLYTNSDGEHIISNILKGSKCTIYFDKIKTASETILDNITLATSGPDFSKIATGNETSNDGNSGIYQIEDGMYGGTSTYWRGATLTNYVKFAGFCWRIVRINGDGSIRLIYDGTTCHANGTKTAESIAVSSVVYNSHYNNSSYVGWTYSAGSQRTLLGNSCDAKTQLESWYNTNITDKGYNSIVIDGKFCNDRNVGQPYSSWTGYVTTWSSTGTKFAYAGVDRLWNKYMPTLSCNSGDIYTLKVGIITADEVEMAGGKNENNTSFYLYNGQNYWTMSPHYWWNRANVFWVNSNGFLNLVDVVDYTSGLRPVINLRSDVTFSGGTGVQSDPFVVAD